MAFLGPESAGPQSAGQTSRHSAVSAKHAGVSLLLGPAATTAAVTTGARFRKDYLGGVVRRR